MSDQPEDLVDFKRQFPTMYERYLELNRAVARILRKERVESGEQSTQEPRAEAQLELPSMLEVE